MKRRRNAWTDYPEELKQELSGVAAPQDPLRTILMKTLAGSKSQSLPVVDLVTQLPSVSDEALVKTIQDASKDGIVSVKGDTIGLTTLGHRASLAIR